MPMIDLADSRQFHATLPTSIVRWHSPQAIGTPRLQGAGLMIDTRSTLYRLEAQRLKRGVDRSSS